MTDMCRTDRATRRRSHDTIPGRQSTEGHDARLDAIRNRVREDLGQARFGRYLGQGTRIETTGDTVEVIAQSTFMAQVLDRNVVPAIRRAMEAEGAAQPTVRVRVERDAAPTAPKPMPSRPQRPAQSPNQPQGQPQNRPTSDDAARVASLRARLEDFQVGESNRLAHSAAVRIAEGIDDAAFSPLFLHGPSGVGKTHLLEGIARRAQERLPGAKVRYVTAEAFTNEFITAIQNRGMDKFRKAWRGVKLLCIDDVHFLRGKQSTQVELLHTLDAIGLKDARIVLASDEPPRKIAELSDQLVSRFMGGAVVRIDEPDETLCRNLLQSLAARRGLDLTPDGVHALAQQAIEQRRRNVREIEGLLTQVAAVHRLLPRESRETPHSPDRIDAQAVRHALRAGDGVATRRPALRGPVRIDTIIRVVCERMHIATDDLFGRGRHRRIVLARGLIVTLARELTTMSYPEIARGLKRPNHSTVITAFNRIERQMKAGEPIACGPDLAGLTIADLLGKLRSAVAESVRR